MKKKTVFTKADQDVLAIVEDGQSGRYKHFIRHLSGRVREIVELKNPLIAAMMVDETNHIVEILDPELKAEREWFDRMQSALKLWHNEKVIANRLLGITNDNEYDQRVFEEVVLQECHWVRKPAPDDVIQTNFETLVLLVETGARRFGH